MAKRTQSEIVPSGSSHAGQDTLEHAPLAMNVVMRNAGRGRRDVKVVTRARTDKGRAAQRSVSDSSRSWMVGGACVVFSQTFKRE